MSRWTSVLFRFIGSVNLFLAAAGLYYVGKEVVFWLTNPNRSSTTPYFYHAFFPMVAINLVFIVLLCLTSLDLLRLRLAGVKRYMWMVLALIGYNLLGALCWFVPGAYGVSIAAATGVGNMGIAPFEFALFLIPEGYPILSLVALHITSRSKVAQS